MLFRRRNVDGEDARQGDGRELNLRVLTISTLAAAAILGMLFFGFGFGQGQNSTPGQATTETTAPAPG